MPAGGHSLSDLENLAPPALRPHGHPVVVLDHLGCARLGDSRLDGEGSFFFQAAYLPHFPVKFYRRAISNFLEI